MSAIAYDAACMMTPVSLAALSAALFLASTLFSHTVALRLTFLVLGTLLCAIDLFRTRNEASPLPPIWLPFLVWAVWGAASLGWSVEPERSAKELRNEVVYTGLALWMCYVAAQGQHAARIIVPTVAAASVLLCAVALYHFGQGFESYAAGWHGGSGNLSSALITLLPCVVAASWYSWRADARGVVIVAAVLAALLMVAAYTTLNRTIWIAFGAQLLVIGGLLVFRLRIYLYPRARGIVIALAIGLVAASAFATLSIQAERQAIGAPEMSHDPRLALWPEIVDYIKARPATGYGFGRGLLRKPLDKDFQNGLLWHAHNLFLDVTLQLGVAGILLLAVLLAWTLRAGWHLARAPDELAAACGMALIAVVVGMVIRNSTDTLLVRQNALLYWGVVGVLLAWGRQALHPPRKPAAA
jgi:O-antigen ligase